MIETDIIILGAGPGGAATALRLDRLGYKSLLVDKATFPRDKVCGDAISGKTVYWLNRIDEDILHGFRKENDLKVNCWGVDFIFPGERNLSIPMPLNLDFKDENPKLEDEKAEGFIAKRKDFDNYLINFVRQSSHIDFRENINISKIEKVNGGFIVKDKKGNFECKAKLVIAADGAQSKFARQFGNIHKLPKHYAGAVRAYYKNVGGIGKFNLIELHYVKEFHPGYLWIFPLPNGGANVGAGMRSDKLSKKKVNLKTDLLKILKEHPRFKDRFKDAVLEEKILGFGLPLGSKKRKISGDHYLLVGDAASLVDPLTGEGIGNAVISGYQAAEQAVRSLTANDYSMGFMKEYDKQVYHRLWKELQISHQLQRAMQYPWLTNITSRIATRNKEFINIMGAMFVDVDMRKKLKDPRFYFKLLFNR